MSIRIYHNPRCSKSRQTLQLLQERGIEPEIIKYLETPPSEDELRRILDMLGLRPRDLMRKREPEYKASGADDPSLSDDELIALMVKYPKLIERPIVVHDGKAALGRPPEQILEIL
ncbi:arsenate reductase (glutaredoxin) [endosymbiont of unidentified scaly snail isolate Monju]|uniref:arsenate reductase (glutaredoxin) n=1 Tax=endosymbiont of unidentified scaly snail isolate Monju TaxID=1248727 RepID=UPI00038926D0|nr:arsenate reductase (glutaredoxin) [endosymbiont of unidentified scaly snail isolate Monju]BAN68692.1 arsenate reductase [endosymbiont of unidentified scaly snail isolate Monju]